MKSTENVDAGLDIQIIEQPSLPDQTVYHIESPYGLVVSALRESTGIYWIHDFDIWDQNSRGQGRGQELLAASYQHAQVIGAASIMASIISRECLVAMQRVFGNDNISIHTEGPFAGPNTDEDSATTSAVLHKSLNGFGILFTNKHDRNIV